MPTSAIPDVIDALVELGRTTFGAGDDPERAVTTYDGYGASEEPGSYLMIGVDDPDVETASTAADSQQSWANVGHTARDETGEITCAAMSWNGDGDQGRARRDVFDVIGQLEDALRADPTLGIHPVMRTGFGTQLEVTQLQDQYGASTTVVFRIRFETRI